jgi:hypothetical protein
MFEIGLQNMVFELWAKANVKQLKGWLYDGVASLLLLRRIANTTCPKIALWFILCL